MWAGYKDFIMKQGFKLFSLNPCFFVGPPGIEPGTP
jgi:hypothetical protein